MFRCGPTRWRVRLDPMSRDLATAHPRFIRRHEANVSCRLERSVAASSREPGTLHRGEADMKRRDFLKKATLLGAALAFNLGEARSSAREWRERRDLYPECVASGDPHPDSVLLCTRRPPMNGDSSKRLTVE